MNILDFSDNNNSILLEEPWFPTLVRACKEVGLEWIRMAAIAYILSDGNPSKRVVDWEFIIEHFIQNPIAWDNPELIVFINNQPYPTIHAIDRGTKWGLFQIHGETALSLGYRGQLVGLASIGSSIKLGVTALVKMIEHYESQAADLSPDQMNNFLSKLPGSAEQIVFGINPEEINKTVITIKEHIQSLMELYNCE